jgi:hypothetical protein
MDEPVLKHARRLQIICIAFAASLAAYAGVVFGLPDPAGPALPQAEALRWGFVFISAANLATVMPTYRAMMAGPRRVFAVGRQVERLLAAHLTAYLVALARVEGVAVLGLLLFFLTGRRDWFWVFVAVAALGTALLWPTRSKVTALLVLPGEAPSTPIR